MASLSTKNKLKGLAIYFVVLIISLLLFINILLIKQNNDVLELNRILLAETEQVKLYTLDIIRNGHQLDMGLRGLALLDNKHNQDVFDYSFFHKDEIFDSLKIILERQNFPMNELKKMLDTTNAYFSLSRQMRQLITEQKREEFIRLLKEDRGYNAWLTYRDFSGMLTEFENKIAADAQAQHKQALQKAFFLQIILFLIAVPTLAYTAYFSTRALSISDKLRITEKDKNELLKKQKNELERMVQERTHEIISQSEEISAQNEEMIARNEQLLNQQNKIENQHKELSEQNHKLKEAHRIIENQNKVILQKNEELVAEVNHQTQDLRETNAELIEQNSRLEQFTFIISHNLRAPMARLVGLSSLLNLSKEEKEKTNIIDLMVRSTSELDNVIKDLSLILGIQKLSTQVYSEIQLSALVDKTVKMLEQDIQETQAEVTAELTVDTIYSLPQYVESILYNLISNAIKYRHPGEKPLIKVKSEIIDNRVVLRISDKGLGIDVDKHRNNLFNLYKRFHFHVEGKGLGLYLVKTQIESLGGTISVESEVGQGTTFIVSIPLT